MRIGDANDVETVTRAIMAFKQEKLRSTLLVVDLHIGWGATTEEDSFSAHGLPFSKTEVFTVKLVYDWPDERSFVSDVALPYFREQLANNDVAQHRAWGRCLTRTADSLALLFTYRC